jgi:FkbM family methyltransferase
MKNQIKISMYRKLLPQNLLKKIVLLRNINLNDLIIYFLRKRHKVVNYNGKLFKFYTPNSVCMWRASTFTTKEPETLNWIDSFNDGSIFYDIGANVGLYSIYAAKIRNCSVYSFEPSVFNLEILAKNVSANGLSDLVTVMPFAISDKTQIGMLNMTSDSYGGALSTFDKSYGSDGNELNVNFRYSMMAISLEDIVNKLNIACPDYIKIDVDGIEELILNGGIEILSKVKGVLIELPDLWLDQKVACEKILINSGLEKIKDSTWNLISNPEGSPNQIWSRKTF